MFLCFPYKLCIVMYGAQLLTGFRNYVSFIDEYTRFSWIFLMTTKSEVCSIFCKFKKYVETLLSHHLKVFQSDGGGEYQSTLLKPFLSSSFIIHQKSCPYTSQQNGLAERKHWYIVEIALTFLAFIFTLPYCYVLVE
ncbi:unnamed protein product [Ilex paraguariensis]|uniref:Integrase catalytic domain-containing protein n=1 Tax=Ilex paraguariensis TaxID=185542 RepID=A0ABC8TG62_9AQUA